MDRLAALKVFRSIAEHGSFAAAAREHRLSPSAVSKNINQLEDHLNARLFNRTTRKLSLTEAGSYYLERVSTLIDDLSEADAVVSSMREEPRGLLRIAAPVTVTLTRLSERIPKFLERYPMVSIQLDLDDRMVNIVDAGYDIAIRGTDTLESSGLIIRKLMAMKHVLCGSPDYFQKHGLPDHPGELADHELVQFSLSGHASAWTFTKNGESHRQPVDGRYKVTSSLAVMDALTAGFGLSLVPRMYVERHLASGTLVSVLDDWQANETTLYAVYPSRRFLSSKVRLFLDFLADEFRGS